jgi:hypothetical protein
VKRRSRTPSPARLAHALVAALLAAGIALRILHFPVAVYTPDEDAYATFYATPMYDNGPGVLPRLVRDYNARPEMSQFPSPTRVGHLWAIVGLMNLAGRATVQTAAAVSTIASIAILLLVARLGLRFLGPRVTAVALLFAVASPLDLAMARRVWGDELFALCALAALLAFLEHAAGARRARSMAVCLAFAGYSILVKESGLLVLGLATAALAVVAWRAAGPRGAARTLLAGAGTLVMAIATLAAACGGIAPLAATFARAAAGATNAYMREYQSGGPGYYARGLLLLQPLPVVLGLLAAIVAAARPRLVLPAAHPSAALALRSLAWLTLAFLAAALAWPQKNLRFLSPIYAPLDLLAAALVWGALERARARLPAAARETGVALAGAALLVAAVADHQRFVELFERRGIPDLATPWFTHAR